MKMLPGPLHRSVSAGLALLLVAGTSVRPAVAEVRFVDAVLAEVGGTLVTVSDLALARALGLSGLLPSAGSIADAEVERYLDAQLLSIEAARLAIEVSAEDVEQAWQAALARAPAGWFEEAGIEPEWGRRLVEADLRRRRFVELRFRAFAFVTESDVSAALGPGPHDEETQRRVREQLEAERMAGELETWREEARRRTGVRRLPAGSGGVPDPLPPRRP
jgi:hypothetical protein